MVHTCTHRNLSDSHGTLLFLELRLFGLHPTSVISRGLECYHMGKIRQLAQTLAFGVRWWHQAHMPAIIDTLGHAHRYE